MRIFLENGRSTLIISFFLLLLPQISFSIKCYFQSTFARHSNISLQEASCECEYCAKAVSKVDNTKEIIEYWCGCRPEFTCRSDGLYRFNSIYDEYAIAHCCSTDLCNSSASQFRLFFALLFLLYVF
ncbi:unnamed protein product, partial [Mesorhabditis belari]|uniref:UPAR/Ly6 domain-containing protein n=1 Tax=Mesorhabditis belari TaxID=2138241 RepID=A0AAF3J4D8_9BILA